MTIQFSIGCGLTKSASRDRVARPSAGSAALIPRYGGIAKAVRRLAAVLLALATAAAAVPALAAEKSPAVKVSGEKGGEDKESFEARLAKGEITFDDLKFDIEKGEPFQREMLTERVKRLDGKNVKLRGYILPSTLFKETNIERFVLVRDNQECCFGPGAALYDCVMIEMVPGNTTDFVTRPVTVEGKFKIQEYKYPDGSGHFAVFRINGVDVN